MTNTTEDPAATYQPVPALDERELATVVWALRQSPVLGLHDALLDKIERMRENDVSRANQPHKMSMTRITTDPATGHTLHHAPVPMEAYEVKTADNRYYIVIAASWNEAAKVASMPDDGEATEITRLTGSEARFPTLLIAGEL